MRLQVLPLKPQGAIFSEFKLLSEFWPEVSRIRLLLVIFIIIRKWYEPDQALSFIIRCPNSELWVLWYKSTKMRHTVYRKKTTKLLKQSETVKIFRVSKRCGLRKIAMATIYRISYTVSYYYFNLKKEIYIVLLEIKIIYNLILMIISFLQSKCNICI